MNPIDPISLIKSDHEKVKKLFAEYKSLDYEDKVDQAMKISENLAIHMEMEEEIFYPEVRKISEEGDVMIADAEEEHDEVKSHIIDIDEADSEEELDDHMDMMEEGVMNHIQEEENSILPLAEKKLADPAKIAARMDAYKAKTKGEAIINKLREQF